MPWPVHPTGFFGARGDQDTYRIERSLRFNSADSTRLYWNDTVGGFTAYFTYSFWIKRSAITSTQIVISAGTNSSNFGQIGFDSSDKLFFYEVVGGNVQSNITTSAVFRDPSAWYHVVFVHDSREATSTNRIKIYVNGAQQTISGTYPNQNLGSFLAYIAHKYIGAQGYGASPTGSYFNGYLTEIFYINAQTLTPSSFAETDSITGRWKAKSYIGGYSTPDYYLNFADNSGTTSTTLGKDSSGNGNNWTPNNFSVTAGAGNDSLVDSPTNYGTDTGVGGEVRGNYCTWNTLVPGDSATNGNLDVTNDTARGNQELMKYNSYWEVTSTGGTCLAGIISTAATSTVTIGSAKTFGFKLSTAGVFEYANVTDGSSFTSQATATTPPLAYASTGASITASLNAGQRPFVAAAPAGFKALCTTNLPQPTIQKPSRYMDVVAYTGTGASNSISSLGFSPDLVWIKNRGTTTDHAVYDTTRGTQLQLSTNSTAAEVTSSTGLTAFGSNGFTVGTSSLVNTSGTQYVAWAWDEAPIAGMDIVSYTGNGTNRTIAHNLGVAPKMVIVKNRNPSVNQGEWMVYHSSLSASGAVFLNLTNAYQASSTYWNNTAPTSSVFTVGTNGTVNENTKEFIAYLFSEVEGFSKFGSYTGNGSADGPFVWCGFRPRYVLIKNTVTAALNWIIHDTARNEANLSSKIIRAQASDAEATDNGIDILSNGFKIRSADGSTNRSETNIFAAFAESPFKYARAR